ncbi:MAG TPA: hypothetical protein VK972_07390 [Wenzhouxiangella sp.]|nr:hypothetical protein [Wenzhouxiangella sp.]
MIRKLFANWQFRTNHPSFTAGERLKVFLTAFDESSGRGEARIGDTILEVEAARPDQLDQLVTLEVGSFDPARHRGQARIVDQATSSASH